MQIKKAIYDIDKDTNINTFDPDEKCGTKSFDSAEPHAQ